MQIVDDSGPVKSDDRPLFDDNTLFCVVAYDNHTNIECIIQWTQIVETNSVSVRLMFP